MKTSARHHLTRLLAEAGGIKMGEVLGVEGGATAGHAHSKPVTGGDPDVRPALLLNDNLHLMVHLLEAVTVHDCYTHTHTHKSINPLRRKPTDKPLLPPPPHQHSAPPTFFFFYL